MAPRAADLDIESQRNAAYAALSAMDQDERKVLLYWLCEHYPTMFITAVEDFRGYGRSYDGIRDQR